MKESKSLKCGSAIKVLSTISLICTTLSCISYFYYYDFDYINGEWVDMGTVFCFPSVFSLISLLLRISPIILLILYVFKFHSNLKATVLIPIIFGILGLNTIFYYLIDQGYRRYLVIEILIYFVFDLIIFFCLILSIISTLNGINKKAPIIISMSGCLLYAILSSIDIFANIEHFTYLDIFTSTFTFIGKISLYTALLLFSFKNKIPSILSLQKEKARFKKMEPEQSLKLLKDKLELGTISEEEYQLQRAEIISKL